MKYDPVSAPSISNKEREFRQSMLEQGKDPETWIANLEEL
jgi:hypothetical protein